MRRGTRRTLDIMQEEQQLAARSNQQILSPGYGLAVAGSALVTAETAYEKSRSEMRRATASIPEEFGISITDSKTGVVEASHP